LVPEIRGTHIVCGYNSRLCKRLQDFSREKFMPIYAYRCESCGFGKDVLQKMSDPQLTQCPECGKDTFRKQVTAAGFQLKGSGWYVTDFRGGNGGASAPAKPDANGDSNGANAKSGENAAAANNGVAKSDTGSAGSTAAAGSSSAAATPAASAAAPAASASSSGSGSA
jgi:putative FmdB family regulatory protein